VELVHVPYKGAGGALIGLLGAEVQAAFFSIPSTLPHLKTGKLRALGIGSLRRSELLPEGPAIAEGGVPNHDSATWYGVLAPPRTPQSVLGKLNREIAASLEGPVMRDRLHSQGAEIRASTPQQFADHIRTETGKYALVAKAIGSQVE